MTKFIIEQKITGLVNQYRVFNTSENGEKQGLISFVQQKRFSLKEEINFYEDEKRSKLIFNVKAEKTLDFHGKFIVKDISGKTIGKVKKSFQSSLLRSTWEIIDADDKSIVTVKEKSLPIAITRRLWQWIPIISDIPFFIKYNFVFIDSATQEQIGSFNKTKLIRDHYEMEADDKLLQISNWQTVVAQGVLLDALQGR